MVNTKQGEGNKVQTLQKQVYSGLQKQHILKLRIKVRKFQIVNDKRHPSLLPLQALGIEEYLYLGTT